MELETVQEIEVENTLGKHPFYFPSVLGAGDRVMVVAAGQPL